MVNLVIGIVIGVAACAVVLFLNPAWSLKRAAWVGKRLESKLGAEGVATLQKLAAKL